MGVFGPVLDIVASLFICNVLSIAMTIFLKWFLYDWNDSGYPFATTMTFVHMLLKWMVSDGLLKWWKKEPKAPDLLSRRDYWTLVVPIAVSASLSVLFSYFAFYYITVTLSTAVRSTQNVWTLLFSIWLGHQRFSWAIVSVIALIASGVALSTLHSTQFNMLGVILMLASAMLQTLQWVLTQSLLKRLDGKVANPVLINVSLTSPAGAVCLVPLVLFFDARHLMNSEITHNSGLLFESSGWVLLGGVLACALVFSKVLLIHQTSALTMGISGSFRDVTQILFAVLCFGDKISLMNGVGLTAVIVGVFLYTLLKRKKTPRTSTMGLLEPPHLPARTDTTRLESSKTVCLSPPHSPCLEIVCVPTMCPNESGAYVAATSPGATCSTKPDSQLGNNSDQIPSTS